MLWGIWACSGEMQGCCRGTKGCGGLECQSHRLRAARSCGPRRGGEGAGLGRGGATARQLRLRRGAAGPWRAAGR